MALGEEVDKIFRREVKSCRPSRKAQAASGSGIAPLVDEMNQLLMGLAIATQGGGRLRAVATAGHATERHGCRR